MTEEFQRLPRIVATMAAEGAIVQMRPDSPVYSVLNKQLLRSPALALDALPIFLPALNSSDATHGRARRVWVLRLLLGALMCGPSLEDARVLRRQFVADLLLSLAASTAADGAARALTLQVVQRAAAHPILARQLVQSGGLVPWLAAVVLAPPQAPQSDKAPPAGGGGGDKAAAAATLASLFQQRRFTRGQSREVPLGEDLAPATAALVHFLTAPPCPPVGCAAAAAAVEALASLAAVALPNASAARGIEPPLLPLRQLVRLIEPITGVDPAALLAGPPPEVSCEARAAGRRLLRVVLAVRFGKVRGGAPPPPRQRRRRSPASRFGLRGLRRSRRIVQSTGRSKGPRRSAAQARARRRRCWRRRAGRMRRRTLRSRRIVQGAG